MNSVLLKESILYGNIGLIYSDRLIKKINFSDFYQQIIQNFIFDDESIFRFMNNLNYIINCNDIEILKNIEKSEIILAIFDFAVSKNNLNISKLEEINIDNTIFIIICYIINNFNSKITQYVNVYENAEVIRKKMEIKYKNIIDFVEKNTIVLDYIKPFEENVWTSSWKLFFKEESKILKHIDTYLDNIFIYNNIKFNINMTDELKIIKKRISFLKENTLEYYHLYVKDCVEVLTERIFKVFPLKIIYKDYLELIKEYNEVHKPVSLKYLKLEDVNENNWILIILPDFLIAYLLGYPIISSDVPTLKNMSTRIKNFDPEIHFKNIAENINQKLFLLSSHDIPGGNGVDGDGYLTNVLYERVVDYNYDDTFMIFDSGTHFVFTSDEYSSLRRSEKNPYNSTHLNIINPMIINQNFKLTTINRYLYIRGINVKLTSTMYNNFEEIKNLLNQEIKEEEKSEFKIEVFYNSIIHNPIASMRF